MKEARQNANWLHWKNWGKRLDSTRLFTCIQEGVLADALYEDGKLMELSLHPLEHASILGNIYIGKVRNIVKNIQAAFVEIENGMLCYLPLEDAQAPVYTKPKKEGQPLVQGDELLVQVSREAVKTKQPSVTTKISMNGKYLVFTIGNGKLGCSGKLSGAEKTRLRQWGQEQKLPEDLGMIIRTNASGVAEEDLNTEFVRLMEQYTYLKLAAGNSQDSLLLCVACQTGVSKFCVGKQKQFSERNPDR